MAARNTNEAKSTPSNKPTETVKGSAITTSKSNGIAPAAQNTSFQSGGVSKPAITRYQSGYMDIKREGADSVNLANLKTAYNIRSVAECQGELAVLEKVEANLEVAIAEQGVLQKGIKLKREEIKTSTEAWKLARDAEKNHQSEDEAKHQNYMTGVKATTNQHRRTTAAANEKIWRHRSQVAVARANKTEVEGYGDIVDVEFQERNVGVTDATPIQ